MFQWVGENCGDLSNCGEVDVLRDNVYITFLCRQVESAQKFNEDWDNTHPKSKLKALSPIVKSKRMINSKLHHCIADSHLWYHVKMQDCDHNQAGLVVCSITSLTHRICVVFKNFRG